MRLRVERLRGDEARRREEEEEEEEEATWGETREENGSKPRLRFRTKNPGF